MSSKRILIRTPQWLGDAVVSTVFLRRLKARYPEADLVVACMPGLAPIFSTHPDVSEVVTLPYPQGNVFAAAKKLAAAQCDTIYVLPRSFRAGLESKLAQIPERIGYTGDLRAWLLTKAISYDDQLLYPHRYLRLIGEQSFPLENVRPYFPMEKPIESKWDLSGVKRPILAVAPISVAPSRTWLPERFVELANNFLNKTHGTVVLFGSPNERLRIDAIAHQINQGTVINTAGQLSLAELGWMISQCTGFLGNDSGLMHVAACFEIPSVILFGASEPKFAVPSWGHFIAIQHREIFCVPCLKNHCVRFGNDHNECLKTISVAEAENALGTVAS